MCVILCVLANELRTDDPIFEVEVMNLNNLYLPTQMHL